MEYPEKFEEWAKHNPWMQENKEEAFRLWYKVHGWKYHKRKGTKPKPPKTKKKKKRKQKPSKKFVDYHDYIRSKEWLDKSRKWRAETKKCEICGSTENLQCHHLHYKTLGNEQRKDIQVVCYLCHCALHGVDDF